ncbi:MAG: DUF2809 domain-containing protein [Ruminococcus flavefaciens]|nr:DUF2809 domain-containing protein [Ruminococcus flavefaciens]MCM1228670.1 DUF2809 domain-containing protein [Ruminococcus flavefaciens]
MKKRLPYIIILVVIIAVEVYIALTQHGWIRSYLGDVIVVWAVYCLVQAIIGGENNHYIVHGGVMIFAFVVEFLQKIHIVDLIGLGHIQFFRILIGTGFSVIDLLCYAIGTAVGCVGSFIYIKMNNIHKNRNILP